MPELPEVETVRRVIEPQIKQKKILSITVNRPEVIAHPAAHEFCSLLAGQRISGMIRRGKFLGIKLESGDCIFLHLRMTGCLLVVPAGYPQEKHTHVIFHLDADDSAVCAHVQDSLATTNKTPAARFARGIELRFSDMRRFGRFWLIRRGETDTYTGIDRLGLEPFDHTLTASYLREHLGMRKKTIKECLLEQNVIAGIGNIYSDEILFTVKLHPTRPANSLTEEEWTRLALIIPERLHYFIEKNAITPQDYLEGRGKDYRNTPFLQVYGHASDPCPVCGQTLVRIVVGGRSSVYCPGCQGRE